MPGMQSVYRTKKDLWIVLIVVAGGLIILLQAGILIAFRGFHFSGTRVVSAAAISYFSLLRLVAYPILYKITASTLEIRSGLLLHYRVPLGSIVGVSLTRNPLSSPAWSLDRLRIDYVKDGRRRSIMISPEEKEAFLRHLAEAAPGLRRNRDAGPGGK